MSHDRDTIAVYDAKARDYEAIAQTEPEGLAPFLAALKPGARVLDLGCGPGHHAERIAREGHRVLAVDASESMVERARMRPGIEVQQLDFDAVATLGRFDGIWASFSLLHARRSAFPGILSDLHAASEPGAPFLICMKTGTGEGTDILGRYYAYYTPDELCGLITAAGFTVSNSILGADKGFVGKLEEWIVVLSHA